MYAAKNLQGYQKRPLAQPSIETFLSINIHRRVSIEHARPFN